jgi:Plasmid stabilization system protein
MKSIKYARRARADLEDIIDYTARTWGADQAKRYTRDIRVQIERIASDDVITQPLRVARSGMFKSRINRHLIIFEQRDDHILIVRILHEAMDIPRQIEP